MEETLRDKLRELLDLYQAGLADQFWWLAALFAAPLLAGSAWWVLRRARGPAAPPPRGMLAWARRELPVAVLMASLVAGLLRALDEASVYDDAFVSFRYARNLAAGRGLVWNPGEHVEGYTNFLWTVLLGALDWATPWEPLKWALVLCPVILALNLVVIFALSRELARGREGAPALHAPLAVVVVALHSVFTVYGTSGMETGLATLLVLLGAYFLVARDDTRGAALAGSALILAALTRPDHGLFYVVGGSVVLASRLRPAWRARADRLAGLWREAGRPLVAYAAPFGVYGVYLLWKLSYYGQLLPNTYYAKSAYLTWWDQGAVYAAMFLCGTHGWLLLVCFLISLIVRPAAARARRFQWFTLGSVLLYGGYVVRVGGDFMYGRFFVVLVPLLALGVGLWVHELARHARRRGRFPLEALAVAGLMLATIPHQHFIEPHQGRWGIVEEHHSYLIRHYEPLRIGHANFRSSQFWRKKVAVRGFDEVVLATGSIGMVGYYTGLTVVDVRGLTDPVVAHTEAEKRGKPGHEKLPPDGYLLERGVHFCRMSSHQGQFHPREYRALATVKLGRIGDRWQIIHYDRDLMRRMAVEVPELHFVDFEAHLDDYIATLDRRDPAAVERDLVWFRSYYFDHNDDDERLAAIEGWLERRR